MTYTRTYHAACNRESVVARDGESMGDAIRRNFKAMFGARMQKRWFD